MAIARRPWLPALYARRQRSSLTYFPRTTVERCRFTGSTSQMQIDPDKAQAYDILSITFGRLLLTVVLTICILVVLVFLLFHPNWPMAALEAFLTGTCYR